MSVLSKTIGPAPHVHAESSRGERGLQRRVERWTLATELFVDLIENGEHTWVAV